MKRIFNITLVFMLLFSLAGVTQTVSAHGGRGDSPQTYTVLVGAEDPTQGIEIDSFFPATLRINVGDTVTWQQNTIEIHTVTFLAGQEMPPLEQIDPDGSPSPVFINPLVAFPTVPDQGEYDGTTFVNSGIMGKAPGQAQTFSLTFTQPGTYEYVCVVHGTVMTGKIKVVSRWKHTLSPDKVEQIAAHQIHEAMEEVPAVIAEANAAVPAPVHNSDGTTSYHVMAGYMKGAVDLMRFFPETLNAHPGDSITWELGPTNMAPHTVTFLNNTEDPELLVPDLSTTPPLLYFNPVVLFPANFTTLTDQGYINSGLLAPMQQTSATLTVGDVTGSLPYVCILHDESGMVGTVNVTAK